MLLNPAVWDMALQSDGKILTVGGTHVARFHVDGRLDTSFGSGGVVSVEFGGTKEGIAQYRASAGREDSARR